jgi:hypothetical protein
MQNLFSNGSASCFFIYYLNAPPFACIDVNVEKLCKNVAFSVYKLSLSFYHNVNSRLIFVQPAATV